MMSLGSTEPSVRVNVPLLWVISIIINVGMWFERFIIIVTSLHHDFLPSSWEMFYPTIWDWGLYIGSIGLFLFLLLLFIRFLPMISVFEMRELVSRQRKHTGMGPGGSAGRVDQVVTKKELLTDVWRMPYGGSDKTPPIDKTPVKTPPIDKTPPNRTVSSSTSITVDSLLDPCLVELPARDQQVGEQTDPRR